MIMHVLVVYVPGQVTNPGGYSLYSDDGDDRRIF